MGKIEIKSSTSVVIDTEDWKKVYNDLKDLKNVSKPTQNLINSIKQIVENKK